MKWFEIYKNLSLPRAKFRSLLTQHYAGTCTLNKLHVKLYASKQDEKKLVGVFLQKKYLLALRHLLQASEEQIVSFLLESLKPPIKKILRAATLQSFEDLFERAVQAEIDELEENPRKGAQNVIKAKPSTVDRQPPSAN